MVARNLRATLAPMIRRALPSLLAVALAACATRTTPPQAPTPAPAPATPPVTAAPVPAPAPVRDISAARAAFVRDTAARFGLDPAVIEATLAKASIRESIVSAMARPAESKPWHAYRPIFMTDARIRGGREFLATHRDALARVEGKYGVPAEIIVAIIGVETSYGGNTGSYPVLDALYTLAFAYPRTGDPTKAAREDQREAFFRDELAQLFALGKETGMDVATLKGSYAGAMGWGQFMPSSYRNHAVDGDGDGKRDLFNDLDDVFASVANYFVQKGRWQRGGVVMLPAERDPAAADFNAETVDPVHTLAELAARGYRPVGSPGAESKATVIRLDGAQGPEYWMVFPNFQAITRYNTSRLYASAVYQLANAIAAPEAPPIAAPAAEAAPATEPAAP